jgi:hypothetical protein
MEIEIDPIERVEERTSDAELGMGQALEGEIGEGNISPDSHLGGREIALRQVDSIIKDMAESYHRTAGVLRTLDRIAGKL